MGSAVDTANLSRNIAAYGKAGIGTLEITPIYGVKGNEANNIDYLTPQWMQMLRHSEAEAARHQMSIHMNGGTGWPFGGPEVNEADAATRAFFEQFTVQGGTEVRLAIQLSNEKDRQRQKNASLQCLMAYDSDGRTIDLTRRVTGGELRWQAPAGEWKLVALFVGKTWQKVKRAAPGGQGLVVDHLNPEAVGRYLAKFDRAFADTRTAFPDCFFNDSYEVYGADWTPALLREFERRRGYRLQDHFIQFLSTERTDETCRVVSDYRQTVSELLLDSFTRPWVKWAHSHGSLTRNQAHGSPANLIDTYAAVDVPECEGFGYTDFHIRGLRRDSLVRANDSDISMLKYASSAAHISGKPMTSSETFTWLTEHFRTSLAQCKPDMDLMFVSGVNRMFFHGTPYSPAEVPWPGWRFYASINMSPTNSIWRDAPAFFSYITRCQSFLQMGRPDNDFLVYLPIWDMWHELPGRFLAFDIHKMDRRAPKFISAIRTILAQGYDVDYISDAFVASTRCKGGKLVTEGGTAYKAIVVPSARLMPEATLQKLHRLAEQGATVVFLDRLPGDVPGMARLDQRRSLFQRLLQRLPAGGGSVGKGRVIVGTDYGKALAATGAVAEEMKTRHGLQFIRRSNATGHHYFVSCLQAADVDAWVTLGAGGAEAMLFNPMTGERGVADSRVVDGKLQVRLQLKSGESVIVQTFEAPQTDQPRWAYRHEGAVGLSLDHGWMLRFIESTPAIGGEYAIDTPRPWTELPMPEARTNMGTACYTLQFDLPAMPATDWLLQLGDVRESARVRINGHDAGTVWAAPFELKVGHLLAPGKNLIEIEVTNLPANRISQLDREGMEWRRFEDINMAKLNYKKGKYDHWEPLPSGLNGGVKLVPLQ